MIRAKQEYFLRQTCSVRDTDLLEHTSVTRNVPIENVESGHVRKKEPSVRNCDNNLCQDGVADTASVHPKGH
jgi:hypothetical protein